MMLIRESKGLRRVLTVVSICFIILWSIALFTKDKPPISLPDWTFFGIGFIISGLLPWLVIWSFEGVESKRLIRTLTIISVVFIFSHLGRGAEMGVFTSLWEGVSYLYFTVLLSISPWLLVKLIFWIIAIFRPKHDK